MSKKLMRKDLNSGWQFRQTDSKDENAWVAVKSVPSVIHLDLLENDSIPDPFMGMSELDVEWIGEKSWTYRVTIQRPDSGAGSVIFLVFEGLDTFATVKLNGLTILESNNMFLTHRINVTDILSSSAENILKIDFASALLRGRDLEKQHPEYRFIAHNGETGRLGVRKAQYHWGWDWGPVLMTAGPWRPVRLEVYEDRISDLWMQIRVDKTLKIASGNIFVRAEGPSADTVIVTIRLREEIILQKEVRIGDDRVAKLDAHIDDPELWYPHGYGAQPLYEIRAELRVGNSILDIQTKRTGLRRGELVQDVDDIGKTFYFRINNVDVFCAGSCWIPADNFIPRITADKYRKWLQLMVDGRQIMTRVWGGGIYEEDVFYDLCDELGILVWQDFMFGCGSYPTWPELLDSIREEAICNIRRLRHHPSIILYAGNNEDYQIQELYNLEYDYENKDAESWLKSSYPARYIYEHLLPIVMKEESPDVAYWPSSPFSDGKRTSDQTLGDIHQWNVWHGTQEKYQIFDSLGGRFNSEFGMEAFPHIETIRYFVKDSAQMYPQSQTLDFHNKADGHERRIATYLVENFRTTTELEEHIHLTQLAQSEALMFAYRGWRRQWGQKRRCGGALVWQLNDCWPVTSWAIVDYFLRKKPAYYAMARCLAHIAVGVRRQHHDWSVCHARPAKKLSWELWAVSSEMQEVKADVELRFISIATGKDLRAPVMQKDVVVIPNSSTDVMKGEIDNVSEEPHILAARIWVAGVLVSRDADWPQPLKYLSFKDRGLTIRREADRLYIQTQKPVKGLTFEEREGVLLSDSAIDVVPRDEQVIQVKGMKDEDEDLSWMFLGRDE